jgi:hypothetical protein
LELVVLVELAVSVVRMVVKVLLPYFQQSHQLAVDLVLLVEPALPMVALVVLVVEHLGEAQLMVLELLIKVLLAVSHLILAVMNQYLEVVVLEQLVAIL